MRYRIPTALALTVLAGSLAGCISGPSEPDMKWADPTKISYYPGLHVDLSRMTKTASGTFYWDSIPGTAADTVKTGDRITARYKLWLPDGTLADSSQSATLRILTDSTITGFVEGVTGTIVGGTRQLVIPPGAAYGSNGNGTIPANTTLIFLVTVNSTTHVTASTTPTAAVVSLSAPPGDIPALTSAVAAALARAHPPREEPALTRAIAGALARSGRASS